MAFLVYKVAAEADFLTTVVVVSVLGVFYVNYRRTVKDINQSIDQAERAEREKVEIVELKAQEVKQHAAELAVLLQKEELINEALKQSRNALEHAAFHDFLTDFRTAPIWSNGSIC